MNKKIAILGANEPLKSFFIQTKQLEYEIHCFAWEEGAVCKDYADYFYPISFIEKEKVLEICQQIKIDGITAFSLESALPSVNFVARKLGLECHSEECEKFTPNKYVMREQLKKSNVNVPDFILVESEADINKQEFQFPVIVKPMDSGGSRGVTLVKSYSELKNAFIRAKQLSKAGKVLIEQFIDGREFSVEYISYRGKHYFVTITDKVTTGTPYFVETEHHQPSNVSHLLRESIKRITSRTLDALRINTGASHTEIKLNEADGKFYIIEMGARMGGDMITSDLVKLSTGYDFIKGVLELSTGKFTKPEFPISRHSGIYFLSNKNPEVLHYIKNAANYPAIVRCELYANEITEIRESNDRAGYFIYKSDKKFELEQLEKSF